MKNLIKLLSICLVFVCVLSFAVSCKSESYGDSNSGSSPSGSTSLVSETTRKIYYSVNLGLEYKDINGLKKQLENKCKGLGGYVERTNESYDGGECYSMSATYRVPTDKLDEFIEFCENDKSVTRKSVSTIDITSSSISANSQRDYLNQKKAIIEEMLEDTNLSAKEKLEILDSIAQVNKEIAALEESIKANTGSFEYSVVYVSVSQPTTFMDVFGPLLIVIGVPLGIFCAIFFGIRGIKKRNRRLAQKQAQQNA